MSVSDIWPIARWAGAWVKRGDGSPIGVVDTHTAGNPTRIVLSGVNLPASDMSLDSVRHWLAREADHYRTRLVHEPRGGGLTCAVLLLPPTDRSQHDVRIVFLEPGSYPPMCGHCTIGAAMTIGELDLLPEARWEADDLALRIATPAGLVAARVRRRAGAASEVTLTNVDSYLAAPFRDVRLADGTKVRVALAWGGDFYLSVDAGTVPVELDRGSAPALISLANAVRKAIEAEPFCDAAGEAIDAYQVLLFDRGPLPDRARTVVVAPPGVIDRSPCGTGSSALAALLVAEESLPLGETLTTASIVGTEFRTVARPSADRPGAISPLLTGSAHVTGFSTVVADPTDPLTNGFEPV